MTKLINYDNKIQRIEKRKSGISYLCYRYNTLKSLSLCFCTSEIFLIS